MNNLLVAIATCVVILLSMTHDVTPKLTQLRSNFTYRYVIYQIRCDMDAKATSFLRAQTPQGTKVPFSFKSALMGVRSIECIFVVLGFFLLQITPDTANQGKKKVECTKIVFGCYILKNGQFLPLILIFTPLFGGVKGTYGIST